MYAVVRQMSPKPGQTVTDQEREECEALMKQLPGFYGQLTVAIGAGTYVRIAVWASDEGRTAIFDYPQTKHYGATIEARMDMPIIGRGEVISNTLIASRTGHDGPR